MSGNQQWSSGMHSGSSQQQDFPRSVQSPNNLNHSLNGSSQEQQMIQPITVNPGFNSPVNAAPFYPNMHFQTYQTQPMSSQGIQPFQFNSRQVAPNSSQSTAQGNHLAVSYGYTPVTGAPLNGNNGVYLYPNPYQLTPVDSGQLQRYQMLLQSAQTGNNQTQTGPYFSGQLTSHRAGSAQSAHQGVKVARYGEANGNRPLSASKYQGVQNKPSRKEPTDNVASLKSQNGALK